MSTESRVMPVVLAVVLGLLLVVVLVAKCT
ncbi:hypothetical protein EDD30_0832 [Couchioplanes caeruleus]|uniref:Uncharacterized protein n=1 Tax=Couchioplanes caeruleus TaxID=56438 RepID=A0A3N1GCX6_9ACTN|nr:hypothetical protein EDD30_0832 [Couchioplanes caeruleus]